MVEKQSNTDALISRQAMLDCQRRIEPFIHHTPVMTSRALDERIGARVVCKCENFQRTGSFKMRGATNAILCLSEQQRARGVVAHSSGNFAQAVALAARLTGIRATIVMPENSTRVKVDAVRGYGGEVVFCDATIAARQDTADRIIDQTGAAFLHPSNDLNVIAGQGTAGLELLQEYPDLDCLITPVGGGGLIAGCALAGHYFAESCVTLGAEPEAVDDAWRSLRSGKIQYNDTTATIADGLRTHLDDNNFPIIREHVTEIIRVDESGIIAAMKFVWERMKIVIEPSSAVAVAAALKNASQLSGQHVGIVLTGGNVDLNALPF